MESADTGAGTSTGASEAVSVSGASVTRIRTRVGRSIRWLHMWNFYALLGAAFLFRVSLLQTQRKNDAVVLLSE